MPPTQSQLHRTHERPVRRSSRLKNLSPQPLPPSPEHEHGQLTAEQSDSVARADHLPSDPAALASFFRQVRCGVYPSHCPIVYRLIRPKGKKVPKWLAPYLKMFMSDGMKQIQQWVDVLSLWLLFESRNGFVEVEGTPRCLEGRMEILADWLEANRSPTWRPDVDHSSSVYLNEELVLYWRSNYPLWFSTSSFTSRDGEWQDWLLNGKCGWLDILASFFFTGRVGVEDFEMPGSDTSVDLYCPHTWYDQLRELTKVLTRLVHGYVPADIPTQ
jgi:hypothetical protein